jgi:imidazolonepropionase
MKPPSTQTMLIGPFSQILTMDGLPKNGPIKDEELEIIRNGGVRVQGGIIQEIGDFKKILRPGDVIQEVHSPSVLMPGLIDAHTHICFAGSRAKDYALRLSGQTYQEIAQRCGGILETVRKTRAATREELADMLQQRAVHLLIHGVTTCEVKSGYGLTLEDEIKILEVIQTVSRNQPVELISTCLAAHIKPEEFQTNAHYLHFISEKLFPELIQRNLTKRIDIFVEKEAFSPDEARNYLYAAKNAGFSICLHADQFSRGGALLAAEMHAISADHLEQSTRQDFLALKKSQVFPIVLPGASIGLGLEFAPARAMIDAGLPLVIASDWNPGSAPMGLLLLQAAVMGVAEKLSMAETLAAMTARAAGALELKDRGILKKELRADMIAFPCKNFEEILYNQGALMPSHVFIEGDRRL